LQLIEEIAKPSIQAKSAGQDSISEPTARARQISINHLLL
jgi:hypothetical protein